MFSFMKSASPVKREPISKAKELLKEKKGAVLLDVRNPDEFRSERIPGSVNLPLGQIQRIEQVVPDKNTPVLVHCLSGARSATAATQLIRMGYTDVTDLGGIHSWPYDTISG